MLNTKLKLGKFSSFLDLLVILNLVLVSFAYPAKADRKTGTTKIVHSDYGLPTHRRDAGSRSSRDNCITDADGRNLIALIPEKTVGINASAAPKLFFYVPKIKKQKTLEFVLRNEQDELIYETFLTTEGKGIMSVEVPADVRSNSLEAAQNYHWYLSMICNSQQRSRDVVVEGWMRQEAIDFATQQELNAANSIEQAELYYEQGFWYDALSILVENQDSSVQQPIIRAKWLELLSSVGLAELASEPFIASELIETSASFPETGRISRIK